MRKDDKKLKEEIQDLTLKWKRALADYQNLEKRTTQEKEEFAKFANTQLLLKILPALDSLEKAGEHLPDEGLSLAIRQLKEGLASQGLERIETLGLTFDPEVMECVEVSQGEEGKILGQARAGYKLNGRVLRVAQVKVGKAEIEENAVRKAEEELKRGDYL